MRLFVDRWVQHALFFLSKRIYDLVCCGNMFVCVCFLYNDFLFLATRWLPIIGWYYPVFQGFYRPSLQCFWRRQSIVRSIFRELLQHPMIGCFFCTKSSNFYYYHISHTQKLLKERANLQHMDSSGAEVILNESLWILAPWRRIIQGPDGAYRLRTCLRITGIVIFVLHSEPLIGMCSLEWRDHNTEYFFQASSIAGVSQVFFHFALRHKHTIGDKPGQTRTLFRRGSFALQKMTMIQTLQSTLEGALTYRAEHLAGNVFSVWWGPCFFFPNHFWNHTKTVK